MGIYLNPGNYAFQESLASQIYVDKTELIAYTNTVAGTKQKYICVSRPRRFGKSMSAEMLAAYYSRSCDSKELFDDLKISGYPTYLLHMNKYNVVFLNMQEFLSKTHSVTDMKALIEKYIIFDLIKNYQDVDYLDDSDLIRVIQDIFEKTQIPFVFIFDEWDCIFREDQNDKEGQKIYLDFLRNMLKDRPYVKLAYMTGILPVKKYGTHSALNMFDEFSMLEPRQLTEFVGFTEEEVAELCHKYEMSFDEIRRWYDGYQFKKAAHVYSPRSVVSAMLSHEYSSYWTQTETYEALRVYIEMNYDGLKDTIIKLLAGGHEKIDTGTFSNDMTSLQCRDDVLTLLVHLGYLGYDAENQEVFIPNSEISGEFFNAIKGAGWNEVIEAVKVSDNLLQATWKKDEAFVADCIESFHMGTSILTYNNENALSYTVSLAYYSARIYYTIVRELPAGKGFADLVFIPRKNHLDKPAMIIELKWDKSATGAITQIKKKQYTEALSNYSGKVLLVGINYDKNSKTHECMIEEISR